MANKKTTQLPENTSPNDNDKIYHVTAAGVSKYIRASTLKAFFLQDVSSGSGAKFRGYKTDEASILALEDPQDGEGAIDRSTNNLWVYVENDSEGNPVNQWINTGEYGPVFEIDAVPTLGNTDHVPSSHGVAVGLGEKANTVHDHSIAETWLINVLSNYVLSSQFNTLFWNRLKASLSQGSGIIINFTEGDKVATINTIGGEGSPSEITISDTITIGDGNAVNSIAVIDYALRKVGYEEIEYAAEIELDAGTDGLRKFKITGVTGAFEITDFLSDDENIATEIYVAVEFDGVAPQPITLPGYVTVNGKPLTENPYTPEGEIGDTITFVVERRVSEWELWTAGSDDIDGSPEVGTLDYEELTNKPLINGFELSGDVSLNDIGVTDAIDAAVSDAVVGLFDDRGNYDASGNTFPSSGGSGEAGAILKGDIWTISVAGTLGGTAVIAGQTVRAKVDTPGTTAGNWAISVGSTEIPNASETVAGKVEEGTDAEVQNSGNSGTGGSGARLFVSIPKLWAWWNYVKTQAQTITGVLTLDNLTANLPLKLNASKQIISGLISLADMATLAANKVIGTFAGGTPQALDMIDIFDAIDDATTVNSSYTTVATDRNLKVDTAAARAITLDGVGARVGKKITIWDDTGSAGTNNITITAQTAQTLVGNGLINSNGGSRTYIWNGTSKWTLISST